MYEENRRRAQEEQSAREQANIQSQQQSAQMASEGEMAVQKDKLAAEKEMLMLKSTEEQKVKVLEIYGQAVSKGIPPTPFMEGIINQLFPNIVIPTSMQNKTYEKAAAVQDQMLAQQEQQQMQEPPMQGQMEQPQEPMQQEQPQMM